MCRTLKHGNLELHIEEYSRKSGVVDRTVPQRRRSRYGHEWLDGAELVLDPEHPQLAGAGEADH